MTKNMTLLESILTEASFFLVSVLFGAIALVITKTFSYLPFLLGWLVFAWILKAVICRSKDLPKLRRVDKADFFVLTLILVFCLFNGAFYYSTLGVTRDYGTYTDSAIIIVKENGLPFGLTSIFPGMGRAIFTGFSVPEQPIGYPTYLAIFYRLVGLKGIFLANIFLLFLSSSLLYFLAKKISGVKAGVLATMLFLTHYTTVYFSRQTLSENLIIFLILFGFYLFILGVLENPDVLPSSLIPIILSLFVRIDGVLYLGSFILGFFLLYFLKKTNIIVIAGKNKSKLVLLLGLILLFFVYFLLFAPANYRYLVILIKVVINLFTFNFKNIPLLFKGAPVRDQPPASYINDIGHIIALLFYYNLIPFILMAVLSFFQKRLRLFVLVITVLALPSFINLFAFTINPDQPWVLRRYWPVFIPFIFLISALEIEALLRKKENLRKVLIPFVPLLIINVFFTSRIFLKTLGRRENYLLGSFAKEQGSKSLVIFSPDYWNTFGRYAGILKYHYGLDSIWPVTVRPSDGEVLNYPIVESIKIREKISNSQKVIVVFDKNGLQKGNSIEWLTAIIEYGKVSKNKVVKAANKTYQLESYFRVPAYQESWPPNNKEEPQEQFTFIWF